MNPEAGEIVPETGGVRRVRWAPPGRGKRSGFRVIYYSHNETFPMLLFIRRITGNKAELGRTDRHKCCWPLSHGIRRLLKTLSERPARIRHLHRRLLLFQP